MLDYDEEEQIYPCPSCSIIFESKKDQEKHMKEVHVEVCNICGKTFRSKMRFISHQRAHEGIPYDCTKCEGTLKDNVQNKDSLERDHVCDICGKGFFRANSLSKHLLTHSDVRNYMCQICGRSFKTSTHLHTHVKYVHRPDKDTKVPDIYVCDICSKPLCSYNSFKLHTRLHSGNNDFKCYDCNKSFTTKAGLNIHVSMLHQGFNRTCVQCKKEFAEDEQVCAHLQRQNIIRRSKVLASNAAFQNSQNECGGCSLKFDCSEDLNNHLLAEGGNELTCSVCSESFSNKCALLHHLRLSHLEDHPYLCFICPVSFRSRSGLYLHRFRLHGQGKPKSCLYCPKVFFINSQKIIHERTHRFEKPFKCDKCESAFKNPSNLRAHQRTHTDERPYVCQICGKRLRLPYNLRVHMRIHTGEKPYICEICGRSFRQPGDLKKHRESHKKQVLRSKIILASRTLEITGDAVAEEEIERLEDD